MSPAENTPNFDAMSPEEIMAWMESLAKRQGANEGFTTSADMDIAEVDPSSVEIDEPGYVPYGKDPKKWAEEEAARKAARPAQPAPAAPIAAQPPPVITSEPAPSAPQTPAAPAQPMRPAAQVPETPMSKPAAPEIPLGQSTMSWLESLAADQGGDMPELDLSALAADITPAAPTPAAKPAVNPMDWLESLTQSEEAETDLAASAVPAEVADPFANGVDPMSWLESVARRQGGKSEELTTEANLNVPEPADTGEIEGPGYTPYSFDTIGLGTRPPEENQLAEARTPDVDAEPAPLEDPGAWLDSLASSQGFTPDAARSLSGKEELPLSDDEIQEALDRGEDIPHEEMERWMSHQLEVGAMREEPEAEYDPDAPAVPAELPDWLIEQVGASKPPEDVVKPPQPQQPALIDLITEPPPASDIPDWLQEETPAESDLDDIFAATAEEPEVVDAVVSAAEPEVDAQDTWAEALEYERQQDISELPDWYVQNISDPARRAVVDRRLMGETVEEEPLEEAVLLPEEELPEGQPEEIPDWLQGVVSEEEIPELATAEDMPDWLRAEVGAPAEEVPAEVVVEPAADIPDWLKSVDVDEVPDWLKETISPPAATSAPSTPPPPAPVVAPQPIVSQPIVSPAVPATPPPSVPSAQPAAAQVEVSATLNDARASTGSGDIEGALRHYEALVRAHVELDAVSADLSRLAEKHKTNPAIFRVLGDSLMRQGKLQAALDTYRKALNQL